MARTAPHHRLELLELLLSQLKTSSRNVEILDLSTLIWEEKAPIDERWISGSVDYFSLLYLDNKPTLIGRFNDTNKNVIEQYNIEKDTWSLEYFDMNDAPCGSNHPCIRNINNIPAELFPACVQDDWMEKDKSEV